MPEPIAPGTIQPGMAGYGLSAGVGSSPVAPGTIRPGMPGYGLSGGPDPGMAQASASLSNQANQVAQAPASVAQPALQGAQGLGSPTYQRPNYANPSNDKFYGR